MSGTGEGTLTYPNAFTQAVSVVASNVHGYNSCAFGEPYDVSLYGCMIRIMMSNGTHWQEKWKLVGMGY